MSNSRLNDLALTALRLFNEDETYYPVVIKEILQVDILHAMTAANLFFYVAFKGGTALRLCYRSARYSEDLDFSTRRPFTQTTVERFRDPCSKR